MTVSPAYTQLIGQLLALANQLDQVIEEQAEFVPGEWELQTSTLAHLDGILLAHGIDREALAEAEAEAEPEAAAA